MTPSFDSNPSISTNSWLSVCSLSSCPPPSPAPLCLPTASISSINIIHGAFFFPCSNKSLTREAPTPTNISTKSEPLILKNGTSASPAIALARRVLPVPGGPISNTPLGILPPSFWNFCGSLRKSIISFNSSFASSIPATFLNVALFFLSDRSLTFALPNESAFPPPICICLMKKSHIPRRSIMGNHEISRFVSHES